MNVRLRYRIVGRRASEIASSIETSVRQGSLTPGAQLPPVRDLGRRLGVSPATVAAAYQLLRSRGLASGQGRRGTRVANRPPLPTPSPAAVPAHLRNLADGNPDPKLLPFLPTALRGLDRRPRLYGEGVNSAELTRLARRQLEADDILGEVGVVSGGLDGIERALQAHLRPGDRVAVEDPGFTGVLDLVSALGLGAEPVGVDDSGPLRSDLERALGTGIAAVVITPRAQNPTGAALDAKRVRELRSVLERHPDVLVVEDDHAGPVSGSPPMTLCHSRRHWAVVRSVSKSLGPDLRLAILAGDPVTVARVEGRQRLGMGWVSHVLQGAVVALWSDRRVTAGFKSAAEAYRARRQELIDALAERGIAAHGRSGLNVWVPVTEEAATVAKLAERGWAVRAGEPYRTKAPPAIRVTVSSLKPREAERFAEDLASSLQPEARTPMK